MLTCWEPTAARSSRLSPSPIPKGPKYQAIGYFRVSTSGIVIMVLGRYLVVGYLDP